MFKRWMMGWMAIVLIASTAPIHAQSQGSSSSSSGADPDTLQAITLPAPVPLPAIHSNPYFPTIAGLTWTYGGNPRELATMIRMLEIQDTSQGPVFSWNGLQGQRWVQNNEDGKVLEYHDNQWRTLFDLNAEAGTTWTIEPFGNGDLLDNAQMTIVSREEKLEVSYGTFAPVIHIAVRNPNLADAGVTDLYFATEIGLVKWSESSIAGPQSFELASFINRNEPPVIVIDPPIHPPFDLADYFPTRPGLVWEYAGSPLKTERKISMAGIERSFPPLTYLWEGLVGAQRIRKTDDGKIMEIIGEGERLLFDLAAEEGTSWTINALEESGNILDGSTVTVISRTEGIVVPYGEFEIALHLGIKPNPQLADAGITDMWFAPGVGLIKWSEITFAGPQTYELVAQSGSSITPMPEPGDSLIVIDPIPIPLPVPSVDAFENRAQIERDGIRYEIGTKQASYNQSDVIEMFYRVTAISNEATFQFNSTQQYDFHFLNESGEVMWVWSANKGFGDALTSFTLKVDDSQTFFARVSLDYEILPGGAYQLLGFMPTSAWQGETIAKENTHVSVPFQLEGDPTRAGLSGTIVDEQNHPVSAVVTLTQSATSTLTPEDELATPAIAVWTAQGGDFNFRGLNPGTYTLTARADNYQIHAQQVNIVSGLNRIEIILKQREQSIYTNIHDQIRGPFIAELATDKQQYNFGDSIYVRYRLTNISANNIELTFPSGQRYDLHLDGSRGRVWTWSQDKSFILALSTETLAAGATYEVETAFVLQDAWNKSDPSFLLTSHLAISSNEQLNSELTQAIVKFAIKDWVPPPPEPQGPLSVSLNVPKEHYAPTENLDINYRLTNTSDEPITLTFSSGQRYDLIIEDTKGPVWGWSWTALFTAEMGELTLAPGESYSIEQQIPLAAIHRSIDLPPQGAYILRVYMTSNDEWADDTEARMRFWVGDIPVPATSGPLTPSLQVPQEQYKAGDTLDVSYKLSNTTEEPITLSFSSGQRYDLVINGSQGAVWGWSWTRSFIAAEGEMTIAPGDAFTFEEKIALSEIPDLPDGAYVLRVYMTSTDELADATEAKMRFWIGDIPEPVVLPTEPPVDPTSQEGSSDAKRMGDFDASGAVDFTDFLKFAAAYGSSSGMLSYRADADLDSDGQVGFSDFLTFASVFGK